MISKLFKLYRLSPFWLRNVIARCNWPLRLAMAPFRTIKIGGYFLVLNFMDNASFKYYTDRDRYERSEMTAFLKCIVHNPGSYILDVGANYGVFSLAAANLSRLNVYKKIIAIEPDRRAYQALSRSIEKNGFTNEIILEQVAAGSVEGPVKLFVNARSSADNRSHAISTSRIRVREAYEVDCKPIDRILEKHSIDHCSNFVIKMDIQGNEYRALQGLAKTLDAAGGYILFFEHCPYLVESAGIQLAEYEKFLQSLKPDSIFEIGSEIRKLDGLNEFEASLNAISSKHETQMEGAGTNYIFCKGMKAACILT